MLILISPAKTLDESPTSLERATEIPFPKETQQLVRVLRKFDADSMAKLMDISEKIAKLNRERFLSFAKEFTPENSKQALLMFKGEVYLGFDLAKYGAEEYEFAQKYLRILSGLYGLLRPLDSIQPYRLEMGRNIETSKGKSLYEFWGDKITTALNKSLAATASNLVINLASQEYFAAINPQKVKGKILTISFKDNKNGLLKIISFNAKKMRGLMANHIIVHKLTSPESLKSFVENGYAWREDLSNEREWVFVKE